MPTTANSASTMIWTTAKLTDVSSPHTPSAIRASAPGIGRAVGRRAAIVAMGRPS